MEYEKLLVYFEEHLITKRDIVFSHNDFQENNVMIWDEDKTRLTLIDFEYSNLNFRGYDIASYVNECFMDYSYPGRPGFKIYQDQLEAFFLDSSRPDSELETLLTHYLSRYYDLTRD